MKIFFKEDLFKRLHNRRPRLTEDNFADVYRCLVNFLKEDTLNNSTPYYYFIHLGMMYMPITKSFRATKIKTAKGLERYEKLVKAYIQLDTFRKDSPLLKDDMLAKYTRKVSIIELENIQNEVFKNSKKQV